MNLLVPIVISVVLAAPGQQGSPAAPAATDAGPRAETPSVQAEPLPELPISLERIQRALSRPPAIRVKGDRPVFRVEVLGRRMTIEDILGPDYLKGPTPTSGMTHQEFLNMVTPKDVQGYAAFNNREAFSVAATSFALAWALQKAIHKFETAKQDREREAARKEVQDALADLEKARARAGLPPK